MGAGSETLDSRIVAEGREPTSQNRNVWHHATSEFKQDLGPTMPTVVAQEPLVWAWRFTQRTCSTLPRSTASSAGWVGARLPWRGNAGMARWLTTANVTSGSRTFRRPTE